MRAVGGFLIFLAVMAFLGASGMDTSVPTSAGSRVHNIGLMRAQENAMLLAVGLFIGGVILFAIGGKKSPTAAQSVDEGESKKCPFCAETIKKDAIVCRYCKRELPAVLAAEQLSSPSPPLNTDQSIARLRGLGYSVEEKRPMYWTLISPDGDEYKANSPEALQTLAAKLLSNYNVR